MGEVERRTEGRGVRLRGEGGELGLMRGGRGGEVGVGGEGKERKGVRREGRGDR